MRRVRIRVSQVVLDIRKIRRSSSSSRRSSSGGGGGGALSKVLRIADGMHGCCGVVEPVVAVGHIPGSRCHGGSHQLLLLLLPLLELFLSGSVSFPVLRSNMSAPPPCRDPCIRRSRGTTAPFGTTRTSTTAPSTTTTRSTTLDMSAAGAPRPAASVRLAIPRGAPDSAVELGVQDPLGGFSGVDASAAIHGQAAIFIEDHWLGVWFEECLQITEPIC